MAPVSAKAKFLLESNMSNTPRSKNTGNSISTAAAILWGSAFILVAMIIIQGGALTNNNAHAELVTSVNGYSMLTGSAGSGPKERPHELLYVADDRDQTLMIYEIKDARTQRGLNLLWAGRLPQMFGAARLP